MCGPTSHRLLFSLLLLVGAEFAAGQSILTVAGSGLIGDGLPATKAILRDPFDLAFDSAGNLYIVDNSNQRVRRVDAGSGVVSTFAGGGTSGLGDGGPATAAQLLYPSGIAIDRFDQVWISEGSRVRVVIQGTITTAIGGGSSDADVVPPALAALNGASGMAFDAAGNLYIAEAGANRVRKLDGRTGILSTVAGNHIAGFSGDGGPALEASLDYPLGVAVDPSGNVLIGDWRNERIRRVDAKTGIITTVAGGGTEFPYEGGIPATSVRLGSVKSLAVDVAGNFFVAMGNHVLRIDANGIATRYAGAGPEDFSGDGGPALEATFNFMSGIVLDRGGNVFVADSRNQRIRRIDAKTRIVTTVAGVGVPKDDGSPATSASLFNPFGVAVDARGDVYFSENFAFRIRKLNRETGIISTVAGIGLTGFTGDGGPATEARMREPSGIAFDPTGNLYVSTRVGQVRRIDSRTGVITTVVGAFASDAPWQSGFGGDGGPATAALINHAAGIAFDAAGNLYIADTLNHRVRKVSAANGVITTIAGSGPIVPDPGAFAGDGGPAAEARLSYPQAVAVDRTGNIYVADNGNTRVRKIDASSGVITTIAGGGNDTEDGALATATRLNSTSALLFDLAGNLLVADTHIIRRIDMSAGIIRTVAGRYVGLTGDGGPALDASLRRVQGMAMDASGNLFVADTDNNRVRALFACVPSVPSPPLLAPADGATDVSTSPAFRWNAVPGGFRYDVFLDTVTPPRLPLVQDLTVTTFRPSNLAPGTKYYWQVYAKSDPFCAPFTIGASAIQSFTTAAGCVAPPAFSLTAPADGAAGLNTPVQLSWDPASGASAYDVYFGTSSPPPLAAAGVFAATFTTPPLAPDTVYYWYVIAHAACDNAKTTSTPIRSFRTAGVCTPAGAFALSSPPPGARNVPVTLTLEWSPSAGASSYDLYLGTTSPSPIYLFDLSKTTLTVSGLQASTTYTWRVVARVACDPTKNVATPESTFTTAGACVIPRPTAITFVPPGSVGVGQTYSISWKESADLDAEGFYIVERALDPTFQTIVDRQETTSTSASFVTSATGTYYHRVRPVRGCNATQPGPASEVRTVTVISGTSNVIFTVQPQAVITALGEKLEDRKSSFTLENLSDSSLEVVLGKGEINSVPFFTVVDPFGGDSVFVTLEPRMPKRFEIHFSGPPNDRAGAYQGLIFVASTGPGLAITPYAFINLKVGGGATAAPQFVSDQGRPTEYISFPGFTGSDTNRPPISVIVRNDGTTPMELGAEIGPEVWLVPESGWNSEPIPPGASRSVKLRTQRSRAPNGSALPRYTYLTVRSRSGASARLLVQDNDALPTSGGRASLLDPGSRAYLIPSVVSSAAVFSRIRLSNVGSSSLQADLIFTPAGADGFDAGAVRRATVVVPANDLVNLTDPLQQVFGLAPPVEGQLEVRAAQEKIGLLVVASTVVAPAATGGGFRYDIPPLLLGEGARLGAPHVLPGVAADANTRATLILAETTGVESTRVRAVLFDKNGIRKGDAAFDVARYGDRRIDDIVNVLGGGTLNAGRIEINAESGGGAVAALVLLLDVNNGNGATIVSQPAAGVFSSSSSYARALRRPIYATAGGSVSAVAPVVINGPLSNPDTSYRTTMGFSTTGSSRTAVVTYRDGTPGVNPVRKMIDLSPGVALYFDNVLEQLFGLAAGQKAQGSIFIESAPGAQIFARLASATSGSNRWSVATGLPMVTTLSELLSSISSRRPLYLDGLEQSIEPTRGTEWSVLLTETAGAGGTVSVRLYESGNRSLPIAAKNVTLEPFAQVKLNPLFGALGLDSEERRKDRTNVLCVVSAESGGATVLATGVSVDNRTGDIRNVLFSPSGGVPATGVLRLTTVAPVLPPQAGRRRAVEP